MIVGSSLPSVRTHGSRRSRVLTPENKNFTLTQDIRHLPVVDDEKKEVRALIWLIHMCDLGPACQSMVIYTT